MTGFDSSAWRRRITIARGTAPADVILGGGRVLNVFSGELVEADVAISQGKIVGVGKYGQGWQTWDCRGKVIIPAFIDPHVHVETSLLWIDEYAKLVVPKGTGAIIWDPHEIANVGGLPALEQARAAAAGLPLRVFFSAPSCVPASDMESPGAVFGPDEIRQVLNWPETVSLGELMDIKGAAAGNRTVAERLEVADGRLIDGHAPSLKGRPLDVYLAAGPSSDHESSTQEETLAKLRAGMMVAIREATSARNLADLLPLVNDQNWPRFCFCSDDRDCVTLLAMGHMDDIVRSAIQLGLNPIRAITMATWNPANHWLLRGLGAVAPGYDANLVILDDLESVKIHATMFAGEMTSREGELLTEWPVSSGNLPMAESIVLAPVSIEDFALPANEAIRSIEVIPDQIVTALIHPAPKLEGDWAVADLDQDLLKITCIERHKASGRSATALIHGFGLKKGAMASSVAHDAHNIVVVGASDADMLAAVAAVAEMEGGLAVVADGQVKASLALPIGGLLSGQPATETAIALDLVEQAARELGCELSSPFGTLEFMALSVIPAARITDRGFVHLR